MKVAVILIRVQELVGVEVADLENLFSGDSVEDLVQFLLLGLIFKHRTADLDYLNVVAIAHEADLLQGAVEVLLKAGLELL